MRLRRQFFRKNTPDEPWPPHEEFAQEAAFDMVARLSHGIYVFPIILVILGTTTTYRADHPLLFWGSAASIAASMGLRIALPALSREIYAFRPGLLVWLGAAEVCLASGVCGAMLAGSMRFYGFEAWPFTVMLLSCLGVAAGFDGYIYAQFRPSTVEHFYALGARSGSRFVCPERKRRGICVTDVLLYSVSLIPGLPAACGLLERATGPCPGKCASARVGSRTKSRRGS